jgi:hypothetical protein
MADIAATLGRFVPEIPIVAIARGPAASFAELVAVISHGDG